MSQPAAVGDRGDHGLAPVCFRRVVGGAVRGQLFRLAIDVGWRPALLVGAIAICTSLLGQACTRPGSGDPADGSGTAAADRRVSPGSPFELRPGETVRLGDAGLRIRFLTVRKDSRCPTGVQCPWAGDAEVVLRAFTGADSTDLVLHTDLEPRSVIVGNLDLRLDSLRPHPIAGTTTPAGDYVATLVAVQR